jgi:hypothetical protein
LRQWRSADIEKSQKPILNVFIWSKGSDRWFALSALGQCHHPSKQLDDRVPTNPARWSQNPSKHAVSSHWFFSWGSHSPKHCDFRDNELNDIFLMDRIPLSVEKQHFLVLPISILIQIEWGTWFPLKYHILSSRCESNLVNKSEAINVHRVALLSTDTINHPLARYHPDNNDLVSICFLFSTFTSRQSRQVAKGQHPK